MKKYILALALVAGTFNVCGAVEFTSLLVAPPSLPAPSPSSLLVSRRGVSPPTLSGKIICPRSSGLTWAVTLAGGRGQSFFGLRGLVHGARKERRGGLAHQQPERDAEEDEKQRKEKRIVDDAGMRDFPKDHQAAAARRDEKPDDGER